MNLREGCGESKTRSAKPIRPPRTTHAWNKFLLCLPKIPYLLIYKKLRNMTRCHESSRKCTFSQDKRRDVHYQSNVDLVPQPICQPRSSGFGESGPQAAAGCAESNCQTTPATPTRPHFLGLAIPSVGQLALISGCCEACDSDEMAAPRFQNIRAPEIENQ